MELTAELNKIVTRYMDYICYASSCSYKKDRKYYVPCVCPCRAQMLLTPTEMAACRLLDFVDCYKNTDRRHDESIILKSSSPHLQKHLLNMVPIGVGISVTPSELADTSSFLREAAHKHAPETPRQAPETSDGHHLYASRPVPQQCTTRAAWRPSPSLRRARP